MNDQPVLDAASPEIQQRITTSFARQRLMTHLGARLTHIGPGRVHILLPYQPEVTQQDGYIHAGATSAIPTAPAATPRSPAFPPTPRCSLSNTRST
jgi:hypothetical protein